MPALLPAKFVPRANAQKTVKFRTRHVQFGDGYSQRQIDGVHFVLEDWNLTFWCDTELDGNELEAFFVARAAWDTVLWTPPNTLAQKRYLVKSLQRRFMSGTRQSEIICTFEETIE